MTKATGATARMLSIDENLNGALTAPVAIRSLGARVAVAVYDGGHLYVAAVDTGEIIHSTRKLPRYRAQANVTAYVGKDTKWPAEARDAEELRKSVLPFDHWLDAHYLDERKLLDLLGTTVSVGAIRLLRHFAEHLAGRNYWFGHIGELSAVLAMPDRSIQRSLKELVDNKLITRTAQGKNWPTKVSVHPWIAWRGDLQARNDALARWTCGRAANTGALSPL